MATILFDRNIERKSKVKNLDEYSEGNNNEYYSKLIKLIPAEVITFYLTLNALVSTFPVNAQSFMHWIALIVVIIGGLFYLKRYNNVYKIDQLFISIIAIVLWVYIIGGPFKSFPWYNQAYGEFLSVIYTFLVPLVYNPKK